ncbi:hypothetical protein BH24DEI2_BH24DEI2_03650 [soil metagenome]
MHNSPNCAATTSSAKVIVGLDTDFFKHFLEGDSTALNVWHQARLGESRLVISCLTLFELQRLGFRGAVPLDKVTHLLTYLPNACEVVWLSQENRHLLETSARLAHGNGLAMADALILSSLIYASADRVYTTDEDMFRYKAGPEMTKL